ncbi:MAG: OmpH family outer membrane protein [Pyrinomonadaceae bacterium]|nr:OmpH family outer membrane protein [Pyrinomonadaceae bacterium]
MKTVRFLVVCLVVIGVCAATGFAQAAAQSKIAIIDTGSFFDPQKGIKKLALENQKLQQEFKPVTDELQTMADKINKLGTEIKAMQENKAVPVNEATLRAKAAEYDKIQRELKFKQDEADANFQRRRAELMQPVMNDIVAKIEAFAKSKGIDLVLDADKLARAQSLLYLNNSINITEAFITYYNAQPAGTATVNQ